MMRTQDGDAMIKAARSGDINKVVEYLDTGVSIESTDQYGNTALTRACDNGSIELVTCLLERKADVNHINQFQCCAIHGASMAGNKDVVDCLIQYGAHVNRPSSRGNRPLHFAALYCKEGLISLLLANGADPTLVNEDGKNAIDTVKDSSIFNKRVIHALYSHCATLFFDEGRLLLHLSLVKDNYSWLEDIQYIANTNTKAVETKDPVTGLYPFQLAAVKTIHLDSCFGLLREAPYLLMKK